MLLTLLFQNSSPEILSSNFNETILPEKNNCYMQSVILVLKCNFFAKFKMLVNRHKKTDRAFRRKAAQGYVYVMGDKKIREYARKGYLGCNDVGLSCRDNCK